MGFAVNCVRCRQSRHGYAPKRVTNTRDDKVNRAAVFFPHRHSVSPTATSLERIAPDVTGEAG